MSNLDLSLEVDVDKCWRILSKYSEKTELIVDDVKKCFEFARKAHEGQSRMSGEPFFTHPAWVAKVVCQLGIGHKSVFAALLHDTAEDTGVKIEEIAENFGDETALLVAGLTEVKKNTKGIEVHETNIDMFRQFLFSSVNDVRVLIVRIVDKLHNGLTIESLPRERQVKYAKRVMGIYGPVAEYVGLHYFKKLLEDIAFKILYPLEANRIELMLRERASEEIKALAMVRESIDEMMRINNINDYEIQGRIKSLYSTYIKLIKKGEDRIKDRVGIRIIVDNIADCYTVLGLLHAKYKYLPDEFDDYISNPKPSGYRSIQTTLLWKDRLTVEVQIRTKEMHEFNEFGPASHIVYKMNKGTFDGMGIEWAKELVKWQAGNGDVKNYQLDVLKNYIYVFTPKGDTIQMEKGSTVLDFAYRIHTGLGNKCKGGKINGKMTKINQELKTGDIVEIMAGKNDNVNKDWLDWVKTDMAKSHIRRKVGE